MKLGTVLWAQWKYLPWNMIWAAFSWKKNVVVIVCIILLCILGAAYYLFMTCAVVVKFEYDKAAHFSFHLRGKSEWSIINLRLQWEGWWAHQFLLMLLWNSACVPFLHCHPFLLLMKCWFLPHVLRNAGKLQRIHQTPCLSWALMNRPETAWSGFLKVTWKLSVELKWIK